MLLALKRATISAFLVAHLGTVLIWNLPPCPLRARCIGALAFYMLPTGQWQHWGMFAPDPVKETITLEAVARDRRGLMHIVPFAKAGDASPWRGPLLYRHCKFAANFALKDEFPGLYEFTARHVARRLDLPAESYPVEVELFYQVRQPPAPGGPPADPMVPPATLSLGTYRFPNPRETLP